MQSNSFSTPPDVPDNRRDERAAATISGFWRRLLAFILDGIILAAAGLVLGAFLFDLLAQLGGWGRLLGFGVALLYFGILNSSVGKGRTIGKRIAKVKVVDSKGNYISLFRSFLRYAILGAPFFLNNALIAPSILMSPIGVLISFIVFGGCGAIVYLYIFNRGTRQSLHDLMVGTYVVRSWAPGKPDVPKVWKGHFAVVGIWFLAVLGWASIGAPIVSRRGPFPELLTVQKSIQASGKVHTSSVFIGKSWGSHGTVEHFSVNALWKTRPEDYEKASEEIASIVLAEYPGIAERDLLAVTVTYGYDIGLARARKSHHVGYSPTQWKEKLEQSRGI